MVSLSLFDYAMLNDLKYESDGILNIKCKVMCNFNSSEKHKIYAFTGTSSVLYRKNIKTELYHGELSHNFYPSYNGIVGFPSVRTYAHKFIGDSLFKVYNLQDFEPVCHLFYYDYLYNMRRAFDNPCVKSFLLNKTEKGHKRVYEKEFEKTYLVFSAKQVDKIDKLML